MHVTVGVSTLSRPKFITVNVDELRSRHSNLDISLLINIIQSILSQEHSKLLTHDGLRMMLDSSDGSMRVDGKASRDSDDCRIKGAEEFTGKDIPFCLRQTAYFRNRSVKECSSLIEFLHVRDCGFPYND